MSTKRELLTAGAANVTVEIEIGAPVARVWEAMTGEVGAWWRPDFLVCEGSKGMRLEGGLGGRLYEETEDGGFVWGTVLSWQPGKQLMYVAQIVPPWGGPAQSVVQINLSGRDGGGTVLTLTDSLIGHVTDELASCLDDGWRQLYGEGGLKGYVEG